MTTDRGRPDETAPAEAGEATEPERVAPADETATVDAPVAAPEDDAPVAAPAADGASTTPPPAPVIVTLLAEPDLPPADLVPPPSVGRAPRWQPAPAHVELEPTEGPVLAETRVTLRGDHLYRESIVRFDGLIAMTVGATEPHELTVRTPPRDRPGPVEVSVQNPGAPLFVVPQAFRYTPLAPPAITSVGPHAGAPKGGTEISVAGSGFVRGSVVLVDGVRAKTTFVDAHTLDAVTPPGRAGAMVEIAVENPDGKRASVPRAFAYDERYTK